MNRRLHGVLVGSLGLLMSAGAVLAGTGGASAATTTAGTVTLTARSAGLTDGSPFTQVSVNKACPTGYQDDLNVFLVTSDGAESGIAFHLTDGGPFASAPITASVPAESTDTTYVNSIADAFANVDAPVVDGTYPIHVVCGSADAAHFPERPTFTGFIDVTGDTWKVDSRPAPTATRITLSASPARHVQVGQTFTLSAAVSPAVPGTVQFSADGGANPIGGPVTVVNGVASVTVPTTTRPTVRSYAAVFVPANQLAHAQAYGVFDYAFLAAPTITVTDASGTVLGAAPQLTGGQRITVSATGFQPTTGEKVTAAITRAHGPLPAGLPSATADTAGSVTGYSVTLPSCLTAGSHQLVLTGQDSGVKLTFAFTTT
jgi:hypothetical protein